MNPEAFREDAPPALALERERSLQRCRERLNERRVFRDGARKPEFRPWAAEDLAALEWTDALAAAGHVGAGQVMRRVTEDRRLLAHLHEAAPAKLEALAARWPRAASVLARRLAALEPLDWERLQRHLAVGEAQLHDPGRGAEMRELKAIAGEPQPQDVAALRADLGLRAGMPRDAGVLLLACAKWRLAAGDRRAARALVERAAALGSRAAQETLFEADFAAAPDKVAFVRGWLDSGRYVTPAVSQACMKLAKDFERGTPQVPADFDEAVRWYARAVGKGSHDSSGALRGGFCGFVAMALGVPWREEGELGDYALAARWHVRSLERGDEDSMAIWLHACAQGLMGIAADPADALERAKRFRASGVDLKAKRWRLREALAAVHAAAQKDARWREVAELLERD
jgi:TPR repeat protein